ncbi:MAG TPA: SPFH domain-containing protein [Verrucomicrobiae bacterium]|nr:SPFH domain-containing protein [Verrucomicrobiae bacterium]
MQEFKAKVFNGFLGLFLVILLIGMGLYLLANEFFLAGSILTVVGIILSSGIFLVQPNQSKSLLFFGHYIGTCRESGLWIGVPFNSRRRISLRVRNFDSKKLKVNDVAGNPIEIAAVVVFKVVDAARALFDVENYEKFVEIQSETALRHVANLYPYDVYDHTGYSLRGNTEEVAKQLALELQDRLAVAGVQVLEARLTHLAYSTEIAGAMLQRQQAAAILAARQIIVDGAVGMVQLAIEKLEKESVIQLDEERKAAMINNLMVAIVSEKSAQPIINAGSLY